LETRGEDRKQQQLVGYSSAGTVRPRSGNQPKHSDFTTICLELFGLMQCPTGRRGNFIVSTRSGKGLFPALARDFLDLRLVAWLRIGLDPTFARLSQRLP
jgi:hypothetical protein